MNETRNLNHEETALLIIKLLKSHEREICWIPKSLFLEIAGRKALYPTFLERVGDILGNYDMQIAMMKHQYTEGMLVSFQYTENFEIHLVYEMKPILSLWKKVQKESIDLDGLFQQVFPHDDE